MKRLSVGCFVLVACLLSPQITYGQVEQLTQSTTRTSFQNDFSLDEGLVRLYRHRLTWPSKATDDTAGIDRRWMTRHRLLGSESDNGIEVYVVSVSPENIQTDTSVSRADAPDTAGFLYRRPSDHLLIYSVDGQTVYRNAERSFDWPEQRSQIIGRWTDRDRLGQRPPWFVRPPYQTTCRMEGRLSGERCFLASGPVRGGDTAWTMAYTDYEEGEGDTRTLRTVRLEFNSGESITRRFRTGKGLTEEITRADWLRSITLMGTESVDETSDNQSDTNRDAPDPARPNQPKDPTDLPDANRPSEPNEPPEPDW